MTLKWTCVSYDKNGKPQLDKSTFEPTQYCFRSDGRVEWICEHGCGHTIYVPQEYDDQWAWWSHGCCGCCFTLNDELKYMKTLTYTPECNR